MSLQSLVGTTVGDYEIISRIGAGGMGAVYEGRHPVIGKRVCIKVMHAHLAEDSDVMGRFIAEARAVNEIRHRGIVDIFAFGQLPDRSPYFIMELLEGQSLEAVIEQRGSLPTVEALPYFVELLEAVGAAHDANIIHRDLKPSNLFMVKPPRGQAFMKVLDFGIAKLLTAQSVTRTRGEMLGTPHYMAPEQVNTKPVGPQTDLYSLGVVFFEVLSGAKPFNGTNSLAVIRQQLSEPAPRLSSLVPTVRPELDDLFAWLLEKELSARPANCDAVLDVLQPLVDAEADLRKARNSRQALKPVPPVQGFDDLVSEKTKVDPDPELDATTKQLRRPPELAAAEPTTDAHPRISAARLPTTPSKPRLNAAGEKPPTRASKPEISSVTTQPTQRPAHFPDNTDDDPTAANALSPADITAPRRRAARPPVVTASITKRSTPKPSRRGLVLRVGLSLAVAVAALGVWGARYAVVLPPTDAELDAGAPAEVDAGEAPTMPVVVVDAGPAPKPHKVEAKPTQPSLAVGKGVLERRLEAARTSLTEREARMGQPDSVLRLLLKQCEDSVGSATTPEALTDAANTLAELEAQLQ